MTWKIYSIGLNLKQSLYYDQVILATVFSKRLLAKILLHTRLCKNLLLEQVLSKYNSLFYLRWTFMGANTTD